MEKMKAAAVTDIKKVEIIEVDKPDILPHELLVKIHATSLCTVEQRNYLGIVDWGKPFIGGHEYCGEVVACGEYCGSFKVGDHVVGNGVYCGGCVNCHSGNSTQCLDQSNPKVKRPAMDLTEGKPVGGACAQYIRIPAINAFKIDDSVSYIHGALVEPISCCLHGVNKLNIKFGDTVVIVGCGIMGIAQVQLCKLRGARVIVSELDEARRAKAIKNGASYAINPAECDPVEKVMELTKGLGATAVINTTPIAAVWEQAIGMLARKGKLLAYSSQHPDKPFGISFGQMHSKEFEFIGTVNAGVEDFVQAIRLVEYGIVDVDELITGIYKFEDAAQAFADAALPSTYRCVITQD